MGMLEESPECIYAVLLFTYVNLSCSLRESGESGVSGESGFVVPTMLLGYVIMSKC